MYSRYNYTHIGSSSQYCIQTNITVLVNSWWLVWLEVVKHTLSMAYLSQIRTVFMVNILILFQYKY